MRNATYNISSIKRVTSKFLEVSRCSRAKQWQRNGQKSVLHVNRCLFLSVSLAKSIYDIYSPKRCCQVCILM